MPLSSKAPSVSSGAWPVFFTPFNEAGWVDYRALEELVDFYIEGGVAGLFLNCLSSEVFSLDVEEMHEIARRVVHRVRGRIGVVAGGNVGADLVEQARGLDSMYATGVDAAVVIVSALPSPHDLAGQLLGLCDLTPVPLGLYECPVPEHRILSPEEVARVAASNRFVFMKETSRDAELAAAKAEAAAGTALRVFPAHLRATPEALRRGAAGHCGVIANVCPELTARMCDAEEEPETRDRAYRALQALHDLMVAHAYPISGKYILQQRGLNLTTLCRTLPADRFTDADRQALDAFLEVFDFQEPRPEILPEVPRAVGDPTRSD